MINKNLRISALALTVAASLSPAARSQTLDLDLIDPNQTVVQGTASVVFDAILVNTTSSTIYLNGDSSTTSSPFLTVDDSPYFNNAPLSLAAGQSSGPFELFAVDLDGGTPVGTYGSNVFSILGGADGGSFTAFSDLADATYSVSVAPAVTTAPEMDPGAALSGFLLLIGCLAVIRGRVATETCVMP